MPFSSGPNTVSDSIVFTYDIGDLTNSYKGEPTTNYWDGTQYSIYNDGATNIRNSTDIAPPIPGYEVVKVTANSIGTYGQCILWKAPYPNNNVATITNSIYAYLTAGSYVQVGQHWYPWNYGSPVYITKNQWVRISNTYTINEGNSYGVAALVYSTDGIAYFAMPQYEYKSYMTSFIGANQTRSTTQGLLDISGNNRTTDLINMSYGANNAISFNGTNSYTGVGNLGNINDFTIEIVFKSDSVANYRNPMDCNWLVYSPGYSNIGPRLEQNSSGNLGWVVGDSVGNYTGVNVVSSGLNGALYHYAAITRTSSYFTAYYNGSQSGTAVFNNWYGAFSNLNIGRGFSTSSERWFIGKIPIVKIYNRVLGASEIANNYLDYKTRFNLS